MWRSRNSCNVWYFRCCPQGLLEGLSFFLSHLRQFRILNLAFKNLPTIKYRYQLKKSPSYFKEHFRERSCCQADHCVITAKGHMERTSPCSSSFEVLLDLHLGVASWWPGPWSSQVLGGKYSSETMSCCASSVTITEWLEGAVPCRWWQTNLNKYSKVPHRRQGQNLPAKHGVQRSWHVSQGHYI